MGATDHTHRTAGPCRATLAALVSGFTLTELMITIAVISVLAVLAAPSLRDFVAKNRIAGVSNEFTAAILTARSEAIRRNTCMTMCVSTSVQDKDPKCAADEKDWQKGWLIFVNPACSPVDEDLPASSSDIVQARAAEPTAYTMHADKNGINFTPQGRVGNTTFELQLAGEPHYAFNRNIVLSAQGRTTIVAASGSDN